MAKSVDHAKKFQTLIKKVLKTYGGQEAPPPADPIVQFVISFLQWNATTQQAEEAYGRIMAEMVDHNDLRVSHVHEVLALLGKNYPQAEERLSRMRQALHEVYEREYATTMQSQIGKPKKEVRHYLETLPGVPAYVSAQTLLLAFGGHAMPVDDRLAELLKHEGAADWEATPDEIGGWLERQVKAAEGVETHLALQAWADSGKPFTKGVKRPDTAAEPEPVDVGTISADDKPAPKKKTTASQSKTAKTTAKSSSTTKTTKKKAAKKSAKQGAAASKKKAAAKKTTKNKSSKKVTKKK